MEEKDKTYSIYAIVNKINNKLYIGQTYSIKNRWCRHKCCAKTTNGKFNLPLYNSMRKHGIDNFELTVIEEWLSLDDANYWEEFYIMFFKTEVQFGAGYNISSGGNNRKISEETKKKISESNKGKKSALGHKHTAEARARMSAAQMGIIRPNFTGKKHSESSKRKTSEKTSGEKNPSAKLNSNQVGQIRNLLLTNITLSAIAKSFGVSAATISSIKHNKTWRQNGTI
jgi:group I intron endonuclease